MYYTYYFFVALSFLPMSVAWPCVLAQTDEVRFTFSGRWALGLMILGAVFDVASLFLPWGLLASSSTYVYLTGSIVGGEGVPLPLPDFLLLMQVRGQLLTVSKLIDVAIIVGFAGIILYCFVERRVLPLVHKRLVSYGVLLASSVLSFMAVAVLALTEIGLSWGAYLAVVGGILVVLGILMKELKVEVVVEREVSEQEE